jgi:hypothetical protein
MPLRYLVAQPSEYVAVTGKLADARQRAAAFMRATRINKWPLLVIAGGLTTPTKSALLAGWGIPNIKICKTVMVYPGQKAIVMDITPQTYSFAIEAMVG